MYLYKQVKEGVLKEVRQKPFSKERELQRICEDNLDLIFELKLVKSDQYGLHGI